MQGTTTLSLRFVFLQFSALETMLRELPSVSVTDTGTSSDLGYAYTSLMSAIKLPLPGLTSCFFFSVLWRQTGSCVWRTDELCTCAFVPYFLKARKCSYDMTKPPLKILTVFVCLWRLRCCRPPPQCLSFWGAFTKLRKETFSFVMGDCVCLSARNSSASIGWIFVEFTIWDLTSLVV